MGGQYPYYPPWHHWGYMPPYDPMCNAAWAPPPSGGPHSETPEASSGHPGAKKKAAGKKKAKRGQEDVPTGLVTGRHTRTTIMLRSLPSDYTRDEVVRLLDKEGFKGLYNFVYMPMCLNTMASFGYAFVNLVSFIVADQCWSRFQGFKKWETASTKACEVSWSDVRQGLAANVENYRNSQIMHESVPELCKPAIFENGCLVPFPAPTRKIKKPQAGR